MIEEKVMYAELRPMLLDKSIPANSGKEEEAISIAAQMQLIIDGVEAKQAELRKKGDREIEKFPFGLKIIYCTPRSISSDRMRTEMVDCIKLKLRYPKLICGKHHAPVIQTDVNAIKDLILWAPRTGRTISVPIERSSSHSEQRAKR
jgi:hypothetical protein